MLLRSSISSGAVAIMGDAPRAIVALADCVVTTVLVIWTGENSINFFTNHTDHVV